MKAGSLFISEVRAGWQFLSFLCFSHGVLGGSRVKTLSAALGLICSAGDDSEAWSFAAVVGRWGRDPQPCWVPYSPGKKCLERTRAPQESLCME